MNNNDILMRFAELSSQRAELEAKTIAFRRNAVEAVREARKNDPARQEAIAVVNELITRFGLKENELFPKGDNELYVGDQGQQWNGHGVMPAWLRSAIRGGRRKQDFRV